MTLERVAVFYISPRDRHLLSGFVFTTETSDGLTKLFEHRVTIRYNIHVALLIPGSTGEIIFRNIDIFRWDFGIECTKNDDRLFIFVPSKHSNGRMTKRTWSLSQIVNVQLFYPKIGTYFYLRLSRSHKIPSNKRLLTHQICDYRVRIVIYSQYKMQEKEIRRRKKLSLPDCTANNWDRVDKDFFDDDSLLLNVGVRWPRVTGEQPRKIRVQR